MADLREGPGSARTGAMADLREGPGSARTGASLSRHPSCSRIQSAASGRVL
jgi:hypothetical protein